MLQMEIPVGAGTNATRVASYNPWVSLYWMVTGKTVGGMALYPDANRLDRLEALRRYTQGSAWFSGEDEKKRAICQRQLADLAMLSADYFSVAEEDIKSIESILIIVDGKIVYGSDDYLNFSPAPLQIVCYFKYIPEGVKRMTGAPVEFDKVVDTARFRRTFSSSRASVE